MRIPHIAHNPIRLFAFRADKLEQIDQNVRRLGRGKTCGLSVHALETGHSIDFVAFQMMLFRLLQSKNATIKIQLSLRVTDIDCNVIERLYDHFIPPL